MGRYYLYIVLEARLRKDDDAVADVEMAKRVWFG